MGKIIGLGGVFLSFKGDKNSLLKWYYETLQLDMSEYGTGFITGEQLMLVSFKREGQDMPLINFRVDNIQEIMTKLHSEGIETSKISEYEYGKFAWFVDPFDNKVELWEAYPKQYKKMVQEEVNKYKKLNS